MVNRLNIRLRFAYSSNLTTHKLSSDHDNRYYTKSEVNTKLNGKSDTSHTHDDRYYTESELDKKLNDKLTKNSNVEVSGVEIKSSVPFIDFHYNNSSTDYTSRIIECKSGKLQIKGTLLDNDGKQYLATGARTDCGGYSFCDSGFKSVNSNNSAWTPVYASGYPGASSRLVKENIYNITDDEAKKILELTPIHFDFIKEFGGQKNQIGLIAEDVIDKIPQCVFVPENYDESKFDLSKGINNKILTLDYSKLSVYIIKMIQILQREIESIKN